MREFEPTANKDDAEIGEARTPEKLKSFEVFDPETGLTEKERMTIEKLTLPQIGQFKDLILGNFNKKKGEVVGSRSEDIIFLLSCISRGHLLVGGSGMMEKTEGRLYLTPNPEHPTIANSKVMENMEVESFYEAVKTNIDDHGYNLVAFTSAITRNLIDSFTDATKKDFEDEVGRHYETASGRFPFEYFFKDLRREIEIAKGSKLGNPFRYRRRNPVLAVLGRHLEEGVFDDVWEFLKSLDMREGIVVGFNQKVLEGKEIFYDYGSSEVHTRNEMAVGVPSGEVNLDNLVGFEVLGDFEENVVKLVMQQEKFLKERKK